MKPGSAAVLLLACFYSAGFVRCNSPAPVTAWGSGSFLPSTADPKPLASAAALSDLFTAVAGIKDRPAEALAGLFDAQQLAEQRPDAVVVIASAAESCSAAVQQKLAELTRAAKSSLALPNAVHKGASHPVFAGLRFSANQLNIKVLGNCGGTYLPGAEPATAEALQQALDGAAGGEKPTVVVVCPATDGDELADGTAVDAEVAMLEAAQKLLEAHVPRHLLVHSVHPASSAQQQRRWLEQQRQMRAARGSAANHTENYTVCDPVCQKHVMFMEGLIVLAVVVIALLVGFTCMHMVDVPTRFAQPEASRQHQD